MKKTLMLIGGIIVLLIAAVLVVNRQTPTQPESVAHRDSHAPVDRPAAPATAPKDVPAHFETAPSRASLGPTLSPDQFTGPTREAYRAAREIPVVIAQMPCYCHCDRGMGHKSLYSCFEDEHASQCAVCVNEALMALKLTKEEKLTAPEIRERINQTFGHAGD